MTITHDTLYLLHTAFDDPAIPGEQYYCRDCITVEGLLAAFPEQAAKLDIRRIEYPKPRPEIVALVGEQNQSLPLLVLAPDGHELATGQHGDTHFINEVRPLLRALHLRHGFLAEHP